MKYIILDKVKYVYLVRENPKGLVKIYSILWRKYRLAIIDPILLSESVE